MTSKRRKARTAAVKPFKAWLVVADGKHACIGRGTRQYFIFGGKPAALKSAAFAASDTHREITVKRVTITVED